jgi:hypothetical protein
MRPPAWGRKQRRQFRFSPAPNIDSYVLPGSDIQPTSSGLAGPTTGLIDMTEGRRTVISRDSPPWSPGYGPVPEQADPGCLCIGNPKVNIRICRDDGACGSGPVQGSGPASNRRPRSGVVGVSMTCRTCGNPHLPSHLHPALGVVQLLRNGQWAVTILTFIALAAPLMPW